MGTNESEPGPAPPERAYELGKDRATVYETTRIVYKVAASDPIERRTMDEVLATEAPPAVQTVCVQATCHYGGSDVFYQTGGILVVQCRRCKARVAKFRIHEGPADAG